MRKFLKNVISKSLVMLASMLLATVFFYVITISFIAIAGNSFRTKLPNSAVLVLDMGAEIPDAPLDTGSLGALLGRQPLGKRLPLKSLLDNIDRAAGDSRIKAILLRGAGPELPSTGFSSIVEIRSALARFRQSGKPVYALLEDAGMKDYALASAADEVWMQPLSTLGIQGLAAESIYLAKAFERYGIRVQTASAGSYKSAIETFTRENMSEEDREQLQAFLDDAWAALALALSESRGIGFERIGEISRSTGLLDAEQARQEGFVDIVGYEDELADKLAQLAGAEGAGFSSIYMADYIAENCCPKLPAKDNADRIAIVYIEGEIVSGRGAWDEAGAERIIDTLRKLRSDDKVRAVVLRVNSPGGSAIASERIRREVEALGRERPIVVSMGRMAASGGYWLSAGADRILVEPTTLTGSIGVFSLFIDIEELVGGWGINSERVTTSPFADMYSSLKEKDPAEMALHKNLVNSIYGRFIEIVASGRNMDGAIVQQLANGRIWSGSAAVVNGLADMHGGLGEAVAEARKLAELDNDCPVVECPVSIGFAEQLSNLFNTRVQSRNPASRLQTLSKELSRCSLTDGAQARLPFMIEGNW